MEDEVIDYLKRLGIPVSESLCKKRIVSHSDYPSILSVSDSLKQLGVTHTVIRVDNNDLDQLPYPAMLHLQAEGGLFLPVYERTDLNRLGEKLNSWSGVLLKAEVTDSIVDKENLNALIEERRFKISSIVLLATVAGLIIMSMLQSVNLAHFLLGITSVAGLIIGYFLFAKDIGITYQVVESFCNAGTSSGCGKVIRSDEGKLFGFITFTDITLCYFFAQLVAIVFFVSNWADFGLLSIFGWLSMFVLPMIIYSFWLQAIKIKAWCRLCMVVSGILIIQASIYGYLFYSGMLNPMAIDISEAFSTMLFFGFSGSSLLLIKQIVLQKNQAIQNEIKSARVKNSSEVFITLLKEQRQVDTTPFQHDFLIGEPDAPVKLTMAINLYCGPCKHELEQAKKLLGIYSGQVSLSLRLLTSGDQGKSSGLVLKTWLYELMKNNNGSPDSQKLIDSWYDLMELEKFLDLYPINEAISDIDTQKYSMVHYDWIRQAEISRTPTTFVNGFELPTAYRVKDLIALIPGITDVYKYQKK